MESQIVAETDYLREADHIEFFKKSLKPLAFVVVPDVYRACSPDRVLTMSVVPGQHLDAFLATHPSQQLRGKVYPPDPKAAARPFDFADPGFLRDFLRAAAKLTRARDGANPEYVFMVRAEVGLYTTLHRLKARVHTSAIVRRLLTASRPTDGSTLSSSGDRAGRKADRGIACR